MPAKVVSSTEAADAAAYVARISGGTPAAPAPSTGPTTTAAPTATAGGRVRLTGDRLVGLVVQLDAPAPADWTVWIEGPGGGRVRVAALRAGATAARAADPGRGRSILGRFDTVLVGIDPAKPALVASFPEARAADLLALLLDDPADPGASVLDAAAAQVAVLHDHVRFLAAARDADNLANVRFHGEHMVNITRGEPLRDIDGNGDTSNPGDGVGLIEGPRAYIARIGTLASLARDTDQARAAALASLIARRGERAGTAGSVAQAVPSIAAIERADAELDGVWARLRATAGDAAVAGLEPQ